MYTDGDEAEKIVDSSRLSGKLYQNTHQALQRMINSGEYAKLPEGASQLFTVLQTYANNNEYPTLAKLEEKIGLNNGEVAQSLGILEREGYIRRAYIPCLE